MSAKAIMEKAKGLGVVLLATPDGKLRWRSSSPLPKGFRDELAAYKSELLKFLGVYGNETHKSQAESAGFGSVTAVDALPDSDETFIRKILAKDWGIPWEQVWVWTPTGVANDDNG